MSIQSLEEELKNTELVDETQKLREKLIEKATRFMNEIRKRYGEVVKSVVIFGSVARGDMKKTSDVDVWVIIDDTISKASEDEEGITRGIYFISQSIGDIHVQITPLTEFWQWIKIGSPELVNYLKQGLVIYDTGFVKPIQRMLKLGLLPPSEEAVKLKAQSAELRLKKIESDLKSMVFDLRYCGSDAIQAVVMQVYKAQPDQKEIPKYLEKLIEEGKVEPEFLEKWERLNSLWKKVEHEEVRKVDATYVAEAEKLAREIVERFKKLVEEGEDGKKREGNEAGRS